MEADRWTQIERLFERLREAPADERAAHLRDHCTDPAVREEVTSLLAAYEEAGNFLGNARTDLSAPPLREEYYGIADDRSGSSLDPLQMVGTRVLRYAVQECVGVGGMGIIYRAWDSRLERSVALKFLPPFLAETPAAEERFVEEARAAARVEHPNVATIHEIGTTDAGRRFLVMAHYDGSTLKEQMTREGTVDVEEAIGYGRTLVEALHQVHKAGLIHRDVKPGNVMITSKGTLKLLDFGVAVSAAEVRLTAPGRRLGTPRYMSPEQAEGEGVGPQTDLWAVGVILYEMLTGKHPFSGEEPPDLLEAIRHDDPVTKWDQHPEVPSALSAIVDRCLSKDPTERYKSAEALASDLASLEGEAQGPRAIAVLPFSVRGATEERGAFTEGMHESLLSGLANLSDLKVTIEPSTDLEDEMGLPSLAEELDVRWILKGNVWRNEGRVQVAAQLVDVPREETVWAETYRRDLTAENLFDVQEQITQAISDALKAKLTPGERDRIQTTPTENLTAYRFYVQGWTNLNRRNEEGLTAAVEQFQQAVEEDATFALAWAGLALAVILFPLYVSRTNKPPAIDAEHAARRALELNPDLAEAHTALGYLQDSPEGTQRLRHAVDLKPSYAQAHQWLGLKSLVDGKVEAAREHASIATDLEPRNRAVQGFRAFQHIAEGQYREGLAIAERHRDSDEAEPDWGLQNASRFLFAALYSLGQWEQAQGLLQQRREETDSARWQALWTAKMGMIELARNNREAAHERVRRLREQSECLYRGLLLFALGEEEAACEALQDVEVWGYYDVIELRYFYPSLLDSFRGTDRFKSLLSIVENRWANPTAAYWHHAE